MHTHTYREREREGGERGGDRERKRDRDKEKQREIQGARDREDLKKKLKKTELGAHNLRARLYVQKETETRSNAGSDMNNCKCTEKDNNKTTSKSQKRCVS